MTGKGGAMHDIIVFCKSYRGDIDRYAVLCQSVQKHNPEKIPFYTVVPREDLPMFRDRFGNASEWLADEDILDISDVGQNWIGQQLVKLNFHKTKIAKNFLLVDSDFFFIKDFGRNDLLFDADTPFTVISSKELFFHGLLRKDDDEYIGMLNEVLFLMGRAKKFTNRPGPDLYFMPGPIWSSKVLEHMDEYLLRRNGFKHYDVLRYCPFENNWYGEWALHSRCIPIYPIEPLFKEYVREKFVWEEKAQGVDLQHIARFYHGISLSSKWNPMTEWKDD